MVLREDRRSRVSAFGEPPESDILKLPLFDWDPERERARASEEEESERLLVWSERERQSGLHLSL